MLSPPQVKYSAREFLKSAWPSTAAYPTRADDPTDFKYALMSRAAALTKAVFRQSNFKDYWNDGRTSSIGIGHEVDHFISNVETENISIVHESINSFYVTIEKIC